jgi:LmbE family N-acetylglucosaminyl deacetylase
MLHIINILLQVQGTKLVYVIVTNGDKGCTPGSGGDQSCANITSTEIADMRAKESQAAAAFFDAKLIMLNGYDDGMLYSYNETKVREDITEHVRREKPDVVMTWKPYPDFSVPDFAGWGDLGFHTDHQDTARHVLDVVKNAAANAFTFPNQLTATGGLQPHR